MKKNFFIFLLITSYWLQVTSFVSAHVLETSGSVGAVMHVTPEDDPIAGEQSDFFFEFKDKENKFKPENCNCTVKILRSGKEIYSQLLFKNNTKASLENVSFSYTFPDRDIYKIKIEGKPTNDDTFAEFNLEYDLRVERVSKNLGQVATAISPQAKSSNWFLEHAPHLIGGLIFGGLFAGVLFARNKRKIAIIILAFLLLAHGLPIKAIHASHQGPFDNGAYECCLPVAAVVPDLTEIDRPIYGVSQEVRIKISNIQVQIPNLLTIRPPPFYPF